MQRNHDRSSPDGKGDSFRNFCCSPDGRLGMAVEPRPGGITVYALEKSLDGFNTAAAAILSGISADAKQDFKFGDQFGEVFFYGSPCGARYDFSSGQMMHVHRNMWCNASCIKSDPATQNSLPETPVKILKDFFPPRKFLFSKKNWDNFILRDADDDWAGYDDPRSDAAVLLLVMEEKFILNACLKKHSPLIVSSLQLPVPFRFPLEFKIGFRDNTGAFVLNDGEFICTYDFKSFTGEVIIPRK